MISPECESRGIKGTYAALFSIKRLPFYVIRDTEVTDGGCWVRGGNNGHYTNIQIWDQTKKKVIQVGLHRVSFSVYRGEVLHGLHIDHLCFVKGCFNPSHLEQITPRLNHHRAIKKYGPYQRSEDAELSAFEIKTQNRINEYTHRKADADIKWALENADGLEVSSGDEEDWILVEKKTASLMPGIPPGGIKRAKRGLLFIPGYPTSDAVKRRVR